MKINFIIPFKRMSGGIKVIYIYANYLTQCGYDVCCYLPMISYRGKNDSRLFQLKASLGNTLKKEKWFECNFPIKLVPIISEKYIRDADVVVASSWQTAYDVMKLSPSKGKKIYFVQGYETFNGEKELVENTYKFNMPIITISNDLKDKLSSFNKDIEVVYNGLYDYEYLNKEKTKNRNFTIMLLFHEEGYKGAKEGLRVARFLKDKYPDVKVNVFGRKINCDIDSDFDVYEDPSKELLSELYRNSDVYLFTSTEEAWGLPIIEAMANKCVVIGRRIGALKEIGNDKNCIIINDESEMIDNVVKVYNDRTLLKDIQKSAYDSVKNLNWEISCAKFKKYLLEGVKKDDQ